MRCCSGGRSGHGSPPRPPAHGRKRPGSRCRVARDDQPRRAVRKLAQQKAPSGVAVERWTWTTGVKWTARVREIKGRAQGQKSLVLESGYLEPVRAVGR